MLIHRPFFTFLYNRTQAQLQNLVTLGRSVLQDLQQHGIGLAMSQRLVDLALNPELAVVILYLSMNSAHTLGILCLHALFLQIFHHIFQSKRYFFRLPNFFHVIGNASSARSCRWNFIFSHTSRCRICWKPASRRIHVSQKYCLFVTCTAFCWILRGELGLICQNFDSILVGEWWWMLSESIRVLLPILAPIHLHFSKHYISVFAPLGHFLAVFSLHDNTICESYARDPHITGNESPILSIPSFFCTSPTNSPTSIPESVQSLFYCCTHACASLSPSESEHDYPRVCLFSKSWPPLQCPMVRFLECL